MPDTKISRPPRGRTEQLSMLKILLSEARTERDALKDANRVLAHQLERRADGMDPLTTALRDELGAATTLGTRVMGYIKQHLTDFEVGELGQITPADPIANELFVAARPLGWLAQEKGGQR